MRRIVIFLLCLMSLQSGLFASSTSTNFAVSNFSVSSGGGNIASTNYEIKNARVSPFDVSSVSSANYAIEESVSSLTGRIATVNSVTPQNLVFVPHEDNASFIVAATDPDGDTLQYAAKQGATTKVSAQSSNTLAWTLGSSDFGRHTGSFDVIDPDGTVTHQQDYFVIHTPVK